MTTLPLVFFAAFRFSVGLSFPGYGIAERFNIGKYARISEGFYSFSGFDINYYVRLSRYPSITGVLPVFTGFQGLTINREISFLNSNIGLGTGVGLLTAGSNNFFFEIFPSLRKSLSKTLHLYLDLTVPFRFSLDGTYIQSVNAGFSVSI